MLRTTPLHHSQALVRDTSLALRAMLDHTLGATLTDLQWEQAALPVRHGGLGIGDPVTIRPFARVGSTLDFLARGRGN